MNIGRYEVIEQLGQGGMALVYLARDPSIKRQVAIKVLPRQFTHSPEFRARFQREAEIIAALEHAAIVPVYDFGEHDDQPFIVMRYLSGGTLADRIGKGPLAVEEIAVLFRRIGAAVDYAHNKGVIHRDIKPGNILFDSQGEASLSDFGIAKIAEATSAFTGTGSMVGTAAYISPEQAQGEKKLTGRTDIYSLGVVLFEALSGELPYDADTPMGVAIAHIQSPIPSLLDRRPDLPPALEGVIRKALDKNPANRFPTASALAQAIQDRGTMLDKGTVADDGRIFEPSALGTIVEPPLSTPKSDPTSAASAAASHVPFARKMDPPPSSFAAASAVSLSPKRSVLPRLIGVGGVLFALCLCVGVVGGFLSGLFPNPFASANATQPPAILPSATSAVDLAPSPTGFVPVGLSSTYIEYILDGSGSMLTPFEGSTRLDVARNVLTARLNALPPNAQVGLRVYGHRIPYQGREAESCKDIELVVPIQANGAQSIVDFLPSMQALGMTPMSASIQQAADDFTFEPGRRNFIVLISDGEETCGDEPADVVKYLKEVGVDFAIHVIGLDVDANTAAQLGRIAEASGGVYYDAKSEKELNNALENIDETLLPSQAPVAGVDATSTPFPPPNAEVASEGKVEASSIYDSTYPASLAVDGDLTTSWFSAGPDADGTSTFVWTGVREDFIASIDLISNRENQVVDFRTGYGFGQVVVQVYTAADELAYEETVSLDGTPDPDVHVEPGVVGQWIRLVFTGSESADCGGFAELKVNVVR